MASACSSGGHPAARSTSTAATSTAPATSATAPATSTTAAAPTTSTSVDATGVVSIDGSGTQIVMLPASVGRPAIVHAHYEPPQATHGPSVRAPSFVVTSLDASRLPTATPVNVLGAFDGTFPVGFVDPHDAPTVALRVATTGPWHLDVARPDHAPPLTGSLAGNGDAVLSYLGPARTVHLTFRSAQPYVVSIYGRDAQRVLASGTGPFAGPMALPAGPAFVAVTATGMWSIRLG